MLIQNRTGISSYMFPLTLISECDSLISATYPEQFNDIFHDLEIFPFAISAVLDDVNSRVVKFIEARERDSFYEIFQGNLFNVAEDDLQIQIERILNLLQNYVEEQRIHKIDNDSEILPSSLNIRNTSPNSDRNSVTGYVIFTSLMDSAQLARRVKAIKKSNNYRFLFVIGGVSDEQGWLRACRAHFHSFTAFGGGFKLQTGLNSFKPLKGANKLLITLLQ